MPRKSHVRKDPEAAQEFKEEFGKRLQALELPAGRKVHVWFADEHRYGLVSTVRRCWTLKGHRPAASYHTKYEWGYVYGAVNAVTCQAEFIYAPHVSLAWSQAYLEQLVATDPEGIHVVVWDQAGFHLPDDAPEVPSAVRVLPLPPYSPELNPVEPMWDPVKRATANRAWETLAHIEEPITGVLAQFWENTEQVRSLLGRSWITDGIQALLGHGTSPVPN